MKYEFFSPGGPALLTPVVHGDSRGFFMETWRRNDFEKHCGQWDFVQENFSKSGKNVLRGMHYQLHHPQGKLVRVTRGRVFDLAVDLRRSSPDFGKCFSAVLDDENRRQFWIPPGFAHGFLVMSDEAEFSYKCTDYYEPDDECCLKWDDPHILPHWPADLISAPLISAKDEKGASFEACPKYD